MRKIKKWMRSACAGFLAVIMAASPVLSSPALGASKTKEELKQYRQGVFRRFEEYLDGFDSYTNLTDDSRYRYSRWARQARYLTTEVDYKIENAEEKTFWEKYKEISDKLDHNFVTELNIGVTWAGHFLTDTKLDEEAYVEYLSRIVAMHEKGFLETAKAQAEYTVKVNAGVELLDMVETTVDTALKRDSLDKLGLKVKDLCGEDTYKTLKAIFKDSKELKEKVTDLNTALQAEVSNVGEAYSLALHASLHKENIEFLQIIYDNADSKENKKLKNAAKILIDASNMQFAGLLLMDAEERAKNLSKLVSAQTGVPDIEECVEQTVSYASTAGAALVAKMGGTFAAQIARGIAFVGSNATLIVAGFKIGASLGRIFMGDKYEMFREMLIMDEISGVLSDALPEYEAAYRKAKKDDDRYEAIYSLAAAGEALCYVRLRGEYTGCEYSKGLDGSPSDEELDRIYENMTKRLNRYYEALNAVFPDRPKQVTVYAERQYEKKVIGDGHVIRDFAIPQVYIEGNEKASKKINESQALRDLRDGAEHDAVLLDQSMEELTGTGAGAAWGVLGSESALWVKDAGVTKQAVSMKIMSMSYYASAAHPISAVYGFNYDTETGEQLMLEDILSEGDGSASGKKEVKDRLAKVLADGFRNMEDGENLLLWGNRTAEDIVAKSFLDAEESTRERHWYLSPEGFHMMFDVYQIGPYVAGNVDTVVPWGELSGIIKPEYMPESFDSVAGQGVPELLLYSNLDGKTGYDAEEHIYGDGSRSFWVGFTDSIAYEVKMECESRMVFYANYMTPHDVVCLNDADPESNSPENGGLVTCLMRDEGAARAKRVKVGFGNRKTQ